VRLTLTGAVIGALGTALLLFEAIRAVSMDDVLSSASELLMWIGFGAMVLGGLLLIAGAWSAPQPAPEE
jgi:hypothetical protein